MATTDGPGGVGRIAGRLVVALVAVAVVEQCPRMIDGYLIAADFAAVAVVAFGWPERQLRPALLELGCTAVSSMDLS